MTLTESLVNAAASGQNKIKRAPMPDIDLSALPLSLPERKASVLMEICKGMPLYIGEGELIVGTRTWLKPLEGNEDGHDISSYSIQTPVPYLNKEELELFGEDQSYVNKAHCTPDLGILLDEGVDGIIKKAEHRLLDECNSYQRDFLRSVIISYNALKCLIVRYAEHARELAEAASEPRASQLRELSEVLFKISSEAPDTFYEAVQLLWLGHLCCIMESFAYVCYGRLDVLLGRFLKDTPRRQAQQLIDCLMVKMYDQADLNGSYFKNYTSQLTVTLGGVLENGEDAVNEVSYMILDAASRIRFPEPELNLRISSKNPPEFLKKATRMSVSGCNFLAYYNDDLFVENLISQGIEPKHARNYGFDLCQDITLPGVADFYAVCAPSLIHLLMDMLSREDDFADFDSLLDRFKQYIYNCTVYAVNQHNAAQNNLYKYRNADFSGYFDAVKRGEPSNCGGKSPAAPLPFLSGLFHGCIQSATDFTLEGYPVKERGVFFGGCVEAINSLAAIKKTVFEDKLYTLGQVFSHCLENFSSDEGKVLRSLLDNCPKWGNDDPYVDLIAKDILEYSLSILKELRTASGAKILGGIHQPHPVVTGKGLMATPDGRGCGDPISVTLTPKSGSAQNGATAIMNSALNIDNRLIDWNFCLMINYHSSVFKHNEGAELLRGLILSYFKRGGMQHQANIMEVSVLKKAQLDPDSYRDLVVRMWGVSARFVDLSRELQDELISRF
ncbi:MAG: hypothetical protein IKK58_00495 [Clostridia bacterium]|nr:hypothetical protein [Clostridia bacterium]